MTVVKQIEEGRSAAAMAAALIGRKCWNVGCGGCVGSSFQLALGGKVRRGRPLRNPTVSPECREFEGEFGLMVWCSWRLDEAGDPITSSYDESPAMEEGLRRLAGKTILRVQISQEWHARIEFSGGLTLSVFPDHVGEEAAAGNWHVRTPRQIYAVTEYLSCEVEQLDVERPAAPSETTGVTVSPGKKIGAPTRGGWKSRGHKAVVNG